jgi:hypothetical protein
LLFLPTLPTAAAIELAVRNNFVEGDEGSLLVVEDATSFEAPDNRIKTEINPGETKAVTSGNVKQFFLNRVFARHRLKYEIVCTAEAKGKKILTLLEIHDEKLPTGCKVTRRGHWSKRSGLTWEEY